MKQPDPNCANYEATKIGAPTPVGLFQVGATPEGICDLAGNVWEWVGDWYGEYPKGKQKNPAGPKSGTSRVLRGAGWTEELWNLRGAIRVRDDPTSWANDVGFRCAREVTL